MKNFARIFSLVVALVMAATTISAMFVTTNAATAPDFTDSFNIKKVETAPVRDGVINSDEYQLISSYAPTNKDWFTADYGNVYRYAAEGNPDYKIELYGAWDSNALYIAVKVGCSDHKVCADPVWNGCGVMIGFVPKAPDCGEYNNYSGYDAMSSVLSEIAFNSSSCFASGFSKPCLPKV